MKASGLCKRGRKKGKTARVGESETVLNWRGSGSVATNLTENTNLSLSRNIAPR
jgi:hypothetical protein